MRSSLAPFRSSADNADDLDQEIGSLIPTDDVHKDKVTWELQPSLKAALRYCSKIAQGVDCSEDISETPLCDPPSSQNSKFKFFTPHNVLGKEHNRLKVNQSSDYQPSPPVRTSGTGAKDKVTPFTMFSQNVLHTEELMRRAVIYSSITDSSMASILKHIPKEYRTKIVQEQVQILHKSSNKAVSAAVTAASNLQLMRRGIALHQL